MAEEPKPKRVIHPDDPDLTELEQALGYAIGAVEVHLKAQKRLLKVLCEMPEGPERDAQAKQFKEIFKETRALPPRPTREIVGFTAYLQPICTLVLALAVMSVGATTARESENREMCARYMAFIGRDQDDPQRQAALKKMADRLEVPSIRGNDVYAFCATYR